MPWHFPWKYADFMNNSIGSDIKTLKNEMRIENSAGEECVMKFLGSREGFHRVFLIDDSASEYAPLIDSQGLQFWFYIVIG